MTCEIRWSRYVSSIVNHLFQITDEPRMLIVGPNKTNDVKAIVLIPSKPIAPLLFFKRCWPWQNMVYPKCRLVLRRNPVELEDFEGVIDIYCWGRAAKVYIKTGSAVAALRGLVGRLEGKQWGEAGPDQILPSAPQAALDIMRSQCLLSMGLGSRRAVRS